MLEFKSIKTIADNKPLLLKLNKIETYIINNSDGIVNYDERKNAKQVFTSNVAESTVNNLINDRQKGKQQMLWSREGAHNVLQIRASVYSNTWDNDWKEIESYLYPLAA